MTVKNFGNALFGFQTNYEERVTKALGETPKNIYAVHSNFLNREARARGISFSPPGEDAVDGLASFALVDYDGQILFCCFRDWGSSEYQETVEPLEQIFEQWYLNAGDAKTHDWSRAVTLRIYMRTAVEMLQKAALLNAENTPDWARANQLLDDLTRHYGETYPHLFKKDTSGEDATYSVEPVEPPPPFAGIS